MTLLMHIADRTLNRPLLITPDKAQVLLQVLGGRIGLNGPEASRFVGDNVERDDDGRPVRTINQWGEPTVKRKPYNVANGVGIITITGSLVNRGAWIGASSGLTSYEGIQHQLGAAAGDADVHAVILDLATPGGEAVGAMETAAAVRALAATKPVVAVVNGMAASAGYAIASGATEIVTTETGVSGSIGVVLLHADFSRQLANEGIEPTLIFAGAHKVDGNPFEPLPDTVRADLQAEVDGIYQAFAKAVAAGRGKRLSVAGARKTEARTFVGEAAVAAGLADRVGTFDAVLAQLSKRSSGGRSNVQTRKSKMDNENGTPAAGNAGFSQADLDRARAEGRAEGLKAGATATMDRIKAIVAADGIKGNGARLTAALDLAAQSAEMSAEAIVAFVTSNVPQASGPAKPAAALSERAAQPDSLAVAGQGQESPKGDRSILAAAVAKTNRRVAAR